MLVAAVQLTSTADRARNLDGAVCLIREAASLGAGMICLPEMWPFVGSDEDKVAGAETLQGPSMTAMVELARELGSGFLWQNRTLQLKIVELQLIS